MDWNDLRHLTAFASAGSLSAAARALGVEHATVARRIAALERELALKLLDRRGRTLSLTGDGERVATMAGRMAVEAGGIERLAHGARSELAGTVTISAPPVYAAAILVPRLVGLRRAHPGLSVRLLGETRVASLEKRDADIAVRLDRPRSGDLVAKRIGRMVFGLYASAGYLAETPPDAERVFIGSEGPMAGSPQQRAIEQVAAGATFGILSDQADIQRAFALAGGGVAILPDFMVAAGDGLSPVPTNVAMPVREVWMVVHADMRQARPVRTVMEWLGRDDRADG